MADKRNIFGVRSDASEAPALTLSRYHEDTGSSSRSTFIIEALLLLLCMVILIATAMAIFANALSMGSKSVVTDEAIALAENAAEVFAVNPVVAMGQQERTEAGYTLTCNVEANLTEAGTMYEADIKVAYEGESVYAIHTSRYVSGPQADILSSMSISEVER